MGGLGIPAGEDGAFGVHNADARGLAVGAAFADDEGAFAVHRDVQGAAQVGPHCDVVAIGGINLDAVVFPVAQVQVAVGVRHDAVGQVEFAGAALARHAPGGFELAVGGEAMHPRVAVAVGDIEVAVGGRDDFGGVVEGAGGAGADFARHFAAGVGVDAALPDDLQGLAVQGVDYAHRVGAVGEIDDVVLDVDAVGFVDGAQAPGAEVVAAGAENQHRGVFALEHINPVAGVGGDGRGVAHSHAFGQVRPVFLQNVGVLAGADGGHNYASF